MEIEPTIPPCILFSDGVIREQGTGKLTIVGTFNQFNAQQFPFQPVPFFVTVTLSNFRGKLDHFKIALRIETKSSGHVVASAEGEVGSQTDLKPADTVEVPFRLTGVFPTPGLYVATVLAQGEVMGSRDLSVNAITAGGASLQ